MLLVRVVEKLLLCAGTRKYGLRGSTGRGEGVLIQSVDHLRFTLLLLLFCKCGVVLERDEMFLKATTLISHDEVEVLPEPAEAQRRPAR